MGATARETQDGETKLAATTSTPRWRGEARRYGAKSCLADLRECDWEIGSGELLMLRPGTSLGSGFASGGAAETAGSLQRQVGETEDGCNGKRNPRWRDEARRYNLNPKMARRGSPLQPR